MKGFNLCMKRNYVKLELNETISVKMLFYRYEIYKSQWTDLRVSSRQVGLCRKPHSSFSLMLSLRSSSLRWEGFDLRAEAREEQLISDSLQPHNLNKI